ncbi:MAG: EAL domain-containing protein [Lachnospiraceae bacterium]|nr:EAL domain-containing protein [Lachnospiraceae bacterium]
MKTVAYRTYNNLFKCALLSVCLDIVSIIAINLEPVLSNLLVSFFCRIYLVSIVAFSCSLISYIEASTGRFGGLAKRKLILPYTILGASAIGIFAFPIAYYINEREIYSIGPSTNVSVAAIVLCYVISMLIILSNWNRMQRGRRNSALVLLNAIIATGMIQNLNRRFLLASIAMSICLVYMYFFLENPDDYVDSRTDAFNEAGLKVFLEDQSLEGFKSHILAYRLSNDGFIEKVFGKDGYLELTREIVHYLWKYSRLSIFSINENVLILSFPESMDPEKLHSEIRADFQKKWVIGQSEVELSFSTVYVPAKLIPDNAEEAFASIMFFVGYMDNETDEVFRVTEKDFEEKEKKDGIQDMLSWAIDKNFIETAYQPIYDIKSGQMVFAEALMRVMNEDGSFLSNRDIMPIAEKSGLILGLGLKHFDNLCAIISKRYAEIYSLQRIGVNLSVLECLQKDLADELLAIMEKYAVSPTVFDFEILGRAADYPGSTIRLNIAKLVAAGSTVSLDQYGHDFLNLKTLIDLPISKIKLNLDLMKEFMNGSSMQQVVALICNIADSMGKQVVAVGVENDAQVEKVNKFSVDYVQGNYFSEPLGEDSFFNLIRDNKHLGTGISAYSKGTPES